MAKKITFTQLRLMLCHQLLHLACLPADGQPRDCRLKLTAARLPSGMADEAGEPGGWQAGINP
jgi:hypothetical protein